MIKIALHSVVSLITNSSTEFYTDFSDSLEPCKDMINEMFRSCGIDKKCDDVFDLSFVTRRGDLLESGDDYEEEPAYLKIKAKDPEFQHLAVLIKTFLESAESKEFMN